MTKDQETNSIRSGFAAIIGRPNVGKSTLMNKIIGQKIAITSNKPQTTRNRIQTVYTDERGQIVFLDTPGIHKQKNRLSEYMVKAAKSTIKDADVVLWLVEASDRIGPGDKQIAEDLKDINIPLVLVINKADTVKHDDMYKIIDTWKDICDFDDIVPVSALKGDNVSELIYVIYKYLPYGERYYDEDTVTDQPVRQISAELIREKALKCLNEEVPHGIAVTIEKMKDAGKIVNIDAVIYCERESHKAIIIGKQGAMLKKIGSAARYEIERLVEKQVNLKLWVKVKKDWRDNDMLLKNFGYREDEL
ncbi:MAG: GTPase Era [Lachnospiraceae bacterium]|nr:GTPase Era [Lachnospiraceae bacterium]